MAYDTFEPQIAWLRERLKKEAEEIRAARRPYTSDAEIAQKTADCYVKYLDAIDQLKDRRHLAVAEELMEEDRGETTRA